MKYYRNSFAKSSWIRKGNGKKMRETDANLERASRIVQETALELKETERIVQETSLQMKETDRKMQETDRKMQETDRKLQETDRIVRKISKFYGGTSRNLGHAAETYFQNSLAKTLFFGNIQYDDMFRNLKKEGKKGSCEFDIVLLNHVAVAIIEVKHRVHPALVLEMVTKKAVEFRKFFPEHKDKALYLGVAGMSMDDAVIEEAKKYGVGVLKQTGDTIEVLSSPLTVY